MTACRWIDVSERLPLEGERVEVRGDYTPDDMPFPLSCWRTGKGDSHWDSREWRGTVAIRQWRPLRPAPQPPARRVP